MTRPRATAKPTDRHYASVTGHPGALGSFRRILKVCNLGRIDRAYVPRLLTISLTSLLSGPFRIWEQAAYGRLTAQTSIPPSPIFVIGHWRSGTTHLQNLLCRDRNLGYLSGFQAIAPGFSLVGKKGIRRLLARVVEPRNRTRPMDSIPFSLDAPQEEELALANMTAHSFSHAFVVPRLAERLFQQYVMFDDGTGEAKERWVKSYLTLLRRITLATGGRRLLLKNCTNTARIPTLLDLFPDAKFVYVHRNPYDVFMSTMHLHRSLLSVCQLQHISDGDVERNVLRFYRQLMLKFLSDRSRIPTGSFVELSYADLDRDPLREVRKIYSSLDIPGFADAEPSLRSYIRSVRSYRKNKYRLEPGTIAKVNRNWAFAFDQWQYEIL